MSGLRKEDNERFDRFREKAITALSVPPITDRHVGWVAGLPKQYYASDIQIHRDVIALVKAHAS